MKKLQALLRHDAIGGILIITATILALICQNTILTDFYNELLRTESGFVIGEYKVIKPILLWVNDGLMAVFFFAIGLEIKKEIMIGELSTPSKVALPVIGGIGGVVVPSLIFVAFTFSDPFLVKGWAIPTVSDTAFALGILLLLGSRVPPSLRLFLLLLAIIDDICAVVIIAIFYTGELSNFALYMAGVAFVIMAVLNILKVNKPLFYFAAGAFMWVAFLESGVHSTIAGIVASLFIPLKPIKGYRMLIGIEHSLKGVITYFIMPVFAFVNAGIALNSQAFLGLLHPVSLGIIFGLLIGKPVGIFIFSYAAIKLKLSNLPTGSNFKQFLGLGFLTGIGASMSLFIDSIAYEDSDLFVYADKLAILIASFLAAFIGWFILRNATVKLK
ncbi:Na+/H+ antiporter NhaA [Campylobacter geochelonis]|uniref:Na+/H+ antiporter NhaA n=1 Tax=Campylobacter geochelonis TaxID=1780362 RepID=UPI00155DACD8|nr:Na+/H+ antiporter NhaA [Campylobacter geochelonis]QKF71891.1 sodium:proton antiporter [Campylobacter geochelonis]